MFSLVENSQIFLQERGRQEASFNVPAPDEASHHLPMEDWSLPTEDGTGEAGEAPVGTAWAGCSTAHKGQPLSLSHAWATAGTAPAEQLRFGCSRGPHHNPPTSGPLPPAKQRGHGALQLFPAPAQKKRKLRGVSIPRPKMQHYKSTHRLLWKAAATTG